MLLSFVLHYNPICILEHSSWFIKVKHMQRELSGKYISHSGKQTQAFPRHQLPLHFVGASSYQYGKHLQFSYLHLTVAFFMLSNILKAS